jgi:hypothetical protein
MPPQLRLNAVAFISPQNHPILIRTFQKREDDLKYHYIAHTSLDVIEERGEHERVSTRRLPIRDGSEFGSQAPRVLPRLVICNGGRRRLRLYHTTQSENRPCHGIVGHGRPRRGDHHGLLNLCYTSLTPTGIQ